MAKISFSATDFISKDQLAQIRAEWDRLDKEDELRTEGFDWQSRDVYQTVSIDGALAGYAHVVVKAGVGELRSVLVFNAYRGKGLGRPLIDKTIITLENQGIHKITKITRRIYPDYQLLINCGFHEVTKLPQHFGNQSYVLLAKIITKSKGD